jgi:hypothetical protein
MSQDALDRLQAWYADQCDGDWEHDEGIEIERSTTLAGE